MKTRLNWAGFGNLGAECWISPDSTRTAALLALLDEFGLSEASVVLSGHPQVTASPHEVVLRAWQLEELADDYQQFLDTTKEERPRSPRATFAALTQAVNHWRRMPFRDPDLPAELLPDNWIGHQAAARFHELHDRWSPAANEYWQELQG